MAEAHPASGDPLCVIHETDTDDSRTKHTTWQTVLQLMAPHADDEHRSRWQLPVNKLRKNRDRAAQHHAELLPCCVETYAGMAPDAIKLLSAIGQMADERLRGWSRYVVIRHFSGDVDSEGQYMAWLSGYSRALAAMA